MGLSLDEITLDFATSTVDASGSEVSLDAATLAALENITVSGSVTVSATDLDIRNLVFATDKVDASGSEVSLDAATLAALETITVTATDLDIRDLTHASDSVKVGDGTEFLAINTDGSINVQQSKYANMKHSQSTVTTTAAEVVATPMTGRQELTIQNEGSSAIYMGFDNSVTAANGLKISKNSSATFLIPEGVDVWMIAASGSQDARFLELG